MKRSCAIVLSVLVMNIVSYAAFSKDDAGTSAAQFLKLGAGARATAMGNAYAGLADDSTAVYWNPAGLLRTAGPELSFMHSVWFEDISYDWFSYSRPVGPLGAFGLGVQYLSYGSITQTDNTGLDTGDFKPADSAVTLSYGRKVCGFLAGVSVKYISSKIVTTATAYALDLGVMRTLLNDKLSLGFTAQNIGTRLKYYSEEEQLPLSLTLGGAYVIKDGWLASLDLNAPVDNEPNIGVGTEYSYHYSTKVAIAVRAGYNTKAKDVGGLNGVSGGIGITYMKYSLDYAFVPYGDLGDTQRISISCKF